MSGVTDSNSYYPSTSQVVAYTGTAGTIANAVGAHTHKVRVVCTTIAFISFTGTATTGDMYVNANDPEVFTIKPGQKVSAIQLSGGGNLHVTELTQ